MRLAKAVALIIFTCLHGAGCGKTDGNANNAPGVGEGANANAAPADAGATLKHLGNYLHSHEEAGIQFETPRGWKLNPMGEQFVLIAPDESISVVFAITDMTSLQQVEEEINEELDGIMDKVKSNGDAQRA